MRSKRDVIGLDSNPTTMSGGTATSFPRMGEIQVDSWLTPQNDPTPFLFFLNTM